MSKRSRIAGFGSAALLILAGILSAFIFSGGLGQNLAFGLVALGLVEGTALVFYEVGLTEDHERERERERKRVRELDRERERRTQASEGGPDKNGQPPASPAPPTPSGAREADHESRLARPRGRDRMRGRPRRLR